MYFVKFFNCGDLVGLPVAVNNPVPGSQVRFQQFRVIERFCIEGSNKPVIVGTLVMI